MRKKTNEIRLVIGWKQKRNIQIRNCHCNSKSRVLFCLLAENCHTQLQNKTLPRHPLNANVWRFKEFQTRSDRVGCHSCSHTKHNFYLKFYLSTKRTDGKSPWAGFCDPNDWQINTQTRESIAFVILFICLEYAVCGINNPGKKNKMEEAIWRRMSTTPSEDTLSMQLLNNLIIERSANRS